MINTLDTLNKILLSEITGNPSDTSEIWVDSVLLDSLQQVINTAWTPVTFDGDNISTGKRLEALRSKEITIAFRVALDADGIYQSIMNADKSYVQFRSSNVIRVNLVSETGETIFRMDGHTLKVSDGEAEFLFSVNMSDTNSKRFIKNGVLSSAGSAYNINDYINFNAINWIVGGGLKGKLIYFLMDNIYTDFKQGDSFTKETIGERGENVTGRVPLVYLTGSEEDWNNPDGLNLGKDKKFFMNGSVTDEIDLPSQEVNYGTPVPEILIQHTVDGQTFSWGVNGFDAQLVTGTFIDGSPWVAPAQKRGYVQINSVSPFLYDPAHPDFTSPQTLGIQQNIDGTGLGGDYQGLLPTASQKYHTSLDVRNQLPLVVQPGADGVSLSTVQFINKNRTSQLKSQCVKCASILTILDEPPVTPCFRPSPYAGDRTIYRPSDFDLNLPQLPEVDLSSNTTPYQTIINWWGQPWLEHVSAMSGEFGRAFVPNVENGTGYSADVAQHLHDHILSLLGTDPLTGDKLQALYSLIQAGIDVYGAWKSGFGWYGGAGQGLGRRARITLFGALINDPVKKDEIANLREYYGDNKIPFQEDEQVRDRGHGPVWGDKPASEVEYWAGVLAGNAFAGAIGPEIVPTTNARNLRDPYGYIDGPAMKPGESYMSCCSTGPMQSYVLIMKLWPAFEYAAGNYDLPVFIDRLLNQGIKTLPDACATPTPNGSGLGVLWGPNPNKPGECITVDEAALAGHPNPVSRYAHLDGNPITIYRQSLLTRELWALFLFTHFRG